MQVDRAEDGDGTEEARWKHPHEGVDAEMRSDAHAVAHAEQDQPGEEDALEFERAAPAGIEAVAGDNLDEGDEA